MKRLLFTLFVVTLGSNLKSQIVDSTFGIPTSLDPCCLIYGATGCNFGGFDQAFLTVHLDDGRIILAGDTRWQGESDFAIVHLMPDGHYDQTAGPDGQVRIDLGYPNDSCLTAARYQGDRIVMGGCVWKPDAAGYVNLIARIDFDGHLDTSFSSVGYRTIDLPSNHEMIVKILPQPDGKVLVAGNAVFGPFDSPDSVNFFIGRLLPDGQVDSTFGTDGFVLDRWEKPCNVALLNDISADALGRVVATGGSYDPYPYNYEGDDWCYQNIFLFRYLPDGSPDPSFGSNGALEIAYTRNGRGNALLHYEDGRILLVGAAGLPAALPAYFFLARFMPDGTPDSSFADNGQFKKGLIIYGLFSGGLCEPFGLLRIRNRIVTGVSNEITGDDPGFGAVCFTEDGKLDSTFGYAGRFNPFPEMGLQSFISQISSSADNNFFLSGYTRILQPNNMAIVKVRWDGSSNTHEHALLSEVKIYPNPVKDGLFHVNLGNPDGVEDHFLLKIRDLNGRILYEQNNIVALATIKSTGFPTGVYLVELVGRSSHYMGKILVQN